MFYHVSNHLNLKLFSRTENQCYATGNSKNRGYNRRIIFDMKVASLQLHFKSFLSQSKIRIYIYIYKLFSITCRIIYLNLKLFSRMEN